MLDPEALRALGFAYEGIGRPRSVSLPAVILVGGQGTRLRPLTDRTRKDMLPLVDRPLARATRSSTSRARRASARSSRAATCPTRSRRIFGDELRRSRARVRASRTSRSGPAGAIGVRRRADLDGSFFALNGDSLREADLGEIVSVPSLHRREGDDPADAGCRPEPLRARPHGPGRARRDVPREAAARGDRHRPHQRGRLRPRARGARRSCRRAALVSIEREVFPRSPTRAPSTGIALPGYWLDVGTPEAYLQAHRDVLERIFSTEVGDALGADFTLVDETRAGASRRASSCRPSTSAPEPSSRRARGSEASPSSAPARAWPGAEWSRTPSSARASTDRGGATASSARSSATTPSSAPAARSGTSAVVGPGAKLGRGNVLDHGLRIGAGPDDPRRRAALLVTSRAAARATPRKVDKPWGWELVWAEADAYVGKLLFVRAGESLSLQYHEREGRVVARPGGPRALELGEVDGELETVEIATGRHLPLPARHRPPAHRARGHARGRGLDEPARRRRPARRPPTAARAPQRPELARTRRTAAPSARSRWMRHPATTSATPASSSGAGT